MENKVVLITGALSGIGKETALAFARAGSKLVVSGRRKVVGEAFATELRRSGTDAEYIYADVSQEEDVERLLHRTVNRFGHLDIAVNSAGFEGVPGPVIAQTHATYAAIFEPNVLGTLLCLKHELLAMSRQKSGSIVNISSTMGHKGARNFLVYSASKHAVEGMTKTAALEAAEHGVRVNAIAPGPVETDMLDRLTGGTEGLARMASAVPLGRVGQPNEIAEAILFISSDRASFITGQIIGVNGGKGI